MNEQRRTVKRTLPMKNSLLIFVLCVIASSCQRHPAVTVIWELPSGIIYKRLENVGNGVRALSLARQRQSDTGYSSMIIVPPDILWCEIRGNQIIGEKASFPPLAQWMNSNDWERAGFFILNPSAIKPQAATEDEMLGTAISWFATKEELEKAIELASRAPQIP
ncbi:MAG: hypothetical protein LR011_02015 [Verrucomicrobia bacterium]|nr:hypothetical protein [Verrucomicrobiota bacterium]